MIILVSPSKDLDYKNNVDRDSIEIPRLWEKSWPIIDQLRKYKPKKLGALMDISAKLAEENYQRNQAFSPDFNKENSRPAIFAFSGDVYRGLDVKSLDHASFDYCSDHLRILSGLYGVLRPMDLVQPYRLEMGTALKVGRKKNLYQYWGREIADLIQADIEAQSAKYLINLASQEYFEAVQLNDIKVPVIDIHFREFKNGKMQFVSFNAKKARGLMVRYMAQNKCADLECIKGFDLESYTFEEKMSEGNSLYFIR
ncbi:MAG: peroxide stress protein YaaA [Saprospiraceae bacterium]|nr:peroxide stress protein YaaA [Candidatus Vicinibacter proximus]